MIGNLYVGSPAQQAGLQPGDMLLAIDGTAPHSAQDALGRIASHKPGTTLVLRGLRGAHLRTRLCVRAQGWGAPAAAMTTLTMRRFSSRSSLDAALAERLARALSAPRRLGRHALGGNTPCPPTARSRTAAAAR